MARIVADKGNGVCVSTTDVYVVTPVPLDVVLVPSPSGLVPIPPVVNTADLQHTIRPVESVRTNGKPVVVVESEIPFSSGAPPNAVKGVASPPPVNNKCTFVTASSTVFAGGKPLVRHRDMTLQNAGNCPGAVKLHEAFTLNGVGLVLDPHLTGAEKEAIVDNLEQLAETPRGNELLHAMQDPTVMKGHNVTMTITAGGNECGGYANPAGRFLQAVPAGTQGPPAPGPGTNSTVYFNPIETFAGTPMARPPAVGLGHELVHAYHAAMGTQPGGTRLLAGQARPTNVRELQAIGLDEYSNDRFTDNAFREEHGLQTRKNHHDGDDFGYDRDSKLAPKRGCRTGANGEKLVYAGG